MKEAQITVSKRDGPSVKVTFKEPESLEDPRWKELVNKPEEDINTLAVSAIRVKVQSGARDELDASKDDNGEAAVQKYLDEYQYKGGRTRGTSKKTPKLSKDAAKKGKFSIAQLAMLAEAGFDVEGDEEKAEA
jgi:hypothetical protein